MSHPVNQVSGGMAVHFHTRKIVLHTSAASIMAFGFLGLHKLDIDTWMRTQYGGHFQFLTVQGLVIAWFTMVMALFSDLSPSSQALRNIKRALLIVAMPLSAVISAIYWALILLCPALILQEQHPGTSTPSSSTELGFYEIPLSLDLSLHAAPALTLLADFWLYEKKYSRRTLRTIAPCALVVFATWYGWWAERCASRNGGVFPYPFLTETSIEVRIAIYAGASALAYASLWAINDFHIRDVTA